MQSKIYYFTGTGNSLKLAKDIAENIENTSVMSIAANIERASDLTPQGIIGFVFPVYYCGLPKIVREFISAIDLSNASYVYIVCTYGASVGNGGCVSQTKKLLKERRYALNAAFYVKTVDNFILWAWDVPPVEKQAGLHEKARSKSEYIARTISAGQKHFDKSFMEYIAPVLFRYKHFCQTVNRDDKAFYSTEKCTSCGLCADVCPTDNLLLKDGRPLWRGEACQRCLACLHLCPSACIQYGKVTVQRQRYMNPYITINELKESKK